MNAIEKYSGVGFKLGGVSESIVIFLRGARICQGVRANICKNFEERSCIKLHRICEDAATATGKQVKRIDVDTLKSYHLLEGQEQMFLKRDCQIALPTGVTATCVYVMPKYTLRYGKEHLFSTIKVRKTHSNSIIVCK